MSVFSCSAVPSFNCLSVLFFLLASVDSLTTGQGVFCVHCTAHSSICRQIKARSAVPVPKKTIETNVACSTYWAEPVFIKLVRVTPSRKRMMPLFCPSKPWLTQNLALKDLHWIPLLTLFKHVCFLLCVSVCVSHYAGRKAEKIQITSREIWSAF